MENKKVFILEWNPAISSYKFEQFEKDFPQILDYNFNWSIWDWEKAKDGDQFYLIKCGEGNTGIVLAGNFCCDPYAGEDWSGKGRPTHYIDMELNCVIHPDKAPMLTTQQLEEAMPEFQWNGGHSGREVPMAYALKLEEMWKDYLEKNEEIFDGERANMYQVFID